MMMSAQGLAPPVQSRERGVDGRATRTAETGTTAAQANGTDNRRRLSGRSRFPVVTHLGRRLPGDSMSSVRAP